MKPRIIPAILTSSFSDISEKVRVISEFASYVQIDIVDGSYAEKPTWPFADDASLEEVPLLDTLPVHFELDLMVRNPEETLDKWLETSAKRCVIHLSSTKNPLVCIRRVRGAGKEAYVGLTVEDEPEIFSDVISEADGVQCMGIRYVGKQGQPFDSDVIPLIRTVQSIRPVPVSVDGAVSEDTIPLLREAGAGQFAVGSSLFRGTPSVRFADLGVCAG